MEYNTVCAKKRYICRTINSLVLFISEGEVL